MAKSQMSVALSGRHCSAIVLAGIISSIAITIVVIIAISSRIAIITDISPFNMNKLATDTSTAHFTQKIPTNLQTNLNGKILKDLASSCQCIGY